MNEISAGQHLVHAWDRAAGNAEQYDTAGSGATRAATVDRSRGGVPPSPLYLPGFRDAGDQGAHHASACEAETIYI